MLEHDERREIQLLREGWRFRREDLSEGALPGLDDGDWAEVRVPHDWAITGPFDRRHDLQRTKIAEDGETKEAEHTGRTGGLPHAGIAWYRRTLKIPVSWADKRVYVEFDGVMSHSTVYLNGEKVGGWPYGYSSFSFDLTDKLVVGGDNLLAVRVDNKPAASRWYPGAGIYRNVRLVATNPVHVAHWGTYITTSSITDREAWIDVTTEVENHTDQVADIELVTNILDPQGQEIAGVLSMEKVGKAFVFQQKIRIPSPLRWDIESPNLYTAVSTVLRDGVIVDRYETPFGLRTLDFDAEAGFSLNGRHLKLKGVCMHHDLGALGSAVNKRAIERQLEKLKEMGANAIRTSHNPPAPELLELCDRMGFLVIDEAFDEWRLGKVPNGYHILFDEWAEKDLRAMIRRDRNHPCIIMWSIGNEIGEQGSEDGAQVAEFLTDICHQEDPTRPVTAGFNASDAAIKNGLAAVVDVPGWNYKPHLYKKYHEEHPEWVMYGSETESCVSSRGEYYFPVKEERDVRRSTLHVTSYDVSAPSWGYPPDYEFKAQEECPFILGEFVWTGFDYLGEPTPYKTEWPSRSSYFGILDLCGFPKDRYFLYRSHWSKEPTLHLLPHWNWPGREGEVTPVHCYTSYPAAELFLNGRSLGIRRKDPESVFSRYRLVWDEVRYEPGTLKVVALDEDGKPAMSKEVKTAGPPARLELEADRSRIRADGEDLSFITVRVVDEEGVLCPLADNLVRFTLNGPAEIAAVDNGDQTSTEPFLADYRKAFHGLCLLVIRSLKGEAGKVEVTASADGLQEARVSVDTV